MNYYPNSWPFLQLVILESIPDNRQKNTKDILGKYAQASSGLAALADLADLGGILRDAKMGTVLIKKRKKAAKRSENH